MGFDVSGATTQAPSDSNAITGRVVASASPLAIGGNLYLTVGAGGLNAGSTTFTAAYRSGTNNVATFLRSSIAVHIFDP
jgi:hypothetical protein